MQNLPHALAALLPFSQFILWTTATRDGNLVKLPVDHRTLQVFTKESDWQQTPEAWTDADTAVELAKMAGDNFNVGFFFTENDPFYFVDLDYCLNSDNTWSDTAMDVMGRLSGAAVEVSQSGTGLHIFGTGVCPEHGKKNKALGLEFYTEKRFAALTGTNIVGDAGCDTSAAMPALVADYFPPKVGFNGPTDWTDAPVPEWTGPEDDIALIEKAKASKSAGAAFGNSASFTDLWDANEDILAAVWPEDDPTKLRNYDTSNADAALAQHLAFWTGNNCERMLRLMWLSGLVRDKWDRTDYLPRTIQNAVSMQETVYSVSDDEVVDPIAKDFGAPKFKGSKAQNTYADTIRAEKLVACASDEDLIKKLCVRHGPTAEPSFWIEHKNSTPEQIAATCAPLNDAPAAMAHTNEATLKEGYQFLGVTQQLEYFKGCVYVQGPHKILTPKGALLKSEQFNATYGGYAFQIEADGNSRTTKKAWEAFTESQAIRFPKAEAMCFDPLKGPGAIVEIDQQTFVNIYIPLATPSTEGDVTPFLTHLAKVLPNTNDQAILLAYMAACVQHQGYKF